MALAAGANAIEDQGLITHRRPLPAIPFKVGLMLDDLVGLEGDQAVEDGKVTAEPAMEAIAPKRFFILARPSHRSVIM